MSKPTTHYGTHIGRTLKASSFIEALLMFPDNEPLEFTVQKQKVRKTQSQNNWLHKLFEFAADEMNKAGFGDGVPWTKDRIKYYCKQVGLYPTFDMVLPGGVVTTMCLDTHELDKEQTMETIDKVLRHFADEHHIYLPEPGEQQEMHL